MVRTSTKVVVILQLCWVFSVILWTLAGPFSAEYFTVQSSRIMYAAVMGDAQGDSKQHRLAQYFDALPLDQQSRIRTAHQRLQERAEKSFWIKTREAMEALLFYLPSFTQAWVFFALCICVMLLLRIEGAALAAWLLPLIALVYAVDNRWNGGQRGHAFDGDLFPTEDYLMEYYVQEPLAESANQHYQQLLGAWRRYLVIEWAHQNPDSDPSAFEKQVEAGEHAFHVARLERHLSTSQDAHSIQPHTQRPVPLLFAYVLWNLFFAYYVNRKAE